MIGFILYHIIFINLQTFFLLFFFSFLFYNQMIKDYSLKEVSAHTTSKSCWVIYKKKVYDVTEFIQDHPGGDDLILDYAGKDVTEVMKDVLEHEHSDSAYEILEEYCIGRLEEGIHDKRMKLLEVEEESKTYGQEDFKPKETDLLSDAKTNQFLDLRKALIPQLLRARYTKEFYLEQVHKPRYMSQPAIFFGHPLLEPLTKTAWYMIPTIWLPYVAYQVSLSLQHGYQNGTIMSFGLGVFIWTLLEYGLHRFLFHLDDLLPNHQLAFVLHFATHGFHHYLPMDR